MQRRVDRGAFRRLGMMVAAAGVLGGNTACETEQLRAVVAGLEAAARVLEITQAQQQEEDTSFRDWLAAELSD